MPRKCSEKIHHKTVTAGTSGSTGHFKNSPFGLSIFLNFSTMNCVLFVQQEHKMGKTDHFVVLAFSSAVLLRAPCGHSRAQGAAPEGGWAV